MSMKFNLVLVLIVALSLAVAARPVDNNLNNICNNAKELEDGTQKAGGSCSKTVQGEIPDSDHMVSTLIVEPENGARIPPNKPFRVAAASTNLITGFFTDPKTQYYVRPQELQDGKIKGHNHVTIQKIEDGKRIPDPKLFAFFKGLDQKAQGGLLTVDVANGLAAGNYRICTMVASFSHQPVLMPVAQRGAQDDCIRIAVTK